MSEPKLVPLVVHVDDRGTLCEICRDDWPEIETRLRQVYVVQNYVKDTIRAFHCHDKLWDYFTIIKGSGKFILFNYDKESEIYQYVLTDKKFQTLIVPPRYMHGWKSLEDQTILVSSASETYNAKNPDEIRISWDYLGKDIWNVKFK